MTTKCKIFSWFNRAKEEDEREVNDFLRQLEQNGQTVLFATQSSAIAHAVGLGEGSRTWLTVFYQ